MSVLVIYEELFLSQLTFVPEEQCFTYPCPCGDKFTFFVVGIFICLNFVGRTKARRACCHMPQLLFERKISAEGSSLHLLHFTSRVNWMLSSKVTSRHSSIFHPHSTFLSFVCHCIFYCIVFIVK